MKLYEVKSMTEYRVLLMNDFVSSVKRSGHPDAMKPSVPCEFVAHELCNCLKAFALIQQYQCEESVISKLNEKYRQSDSGII